MSIATDNEAQILHKNFEDKCAIMSRKTQMQCDKVNALDENEEKFKRKLPPKKDIDFDTVIGYIEDMLVGKHCIVDDEFHELQKGFLEKYWKEFIDSEENKLEYMNIFMEYTNEIEAFIENYLRKSIPHFEMEMLLCELEKRKHDLEGEVFEVLYTFTDFSRFKEMFLDYRMMKEGNIVDVGQSLYVTPIQ